MSRSKPNRSPATLTRNRVNPAPVSGICVTCLDGCPGPCEIGRSAVRGRELLYPMPFGKVTAGSEKDYPVDFSHFNIQGTCVGALGIEADPDKAVFPAVDVSTEIGRQHKIKLAFPAFTGALGSTEIAQKHWKSMAIGAAICGLIIVCGENVCGMDPNAEIKKGRIIRSPEMERRIQTFRQWYQGYGDIIVQANVEDTRLGVPEYIIEKLGVEFLEVKWGQGAKDIGGEVKLFNLDRARQVQGRGYIVLPDPSDPITIEQYQLHGIREFERHSRVAMVTEEDFYKTVERLRSLGAKRVSLKTGAYRPADLALAVKCASQARVDLLTVDGAGGGTGMSPWAMMNEWGMPTVYIESLLYEYLSFLDRKGEFVPDVAIAGGLSMEDHVFKALALGAPYVKLACMGRAIMTATFVGNLEGKKLAEKCAHEQRDLKDAYLEHFAEVGTLRRRYPLGEYGRIPAGGVGLYSYINRMTQGLQQFLAGARKFSLKYLSRDDLVALTEEAARVSGLPYIMDADAAAVEKILGYRR
ncbi:MAG: FMN-binding glutamate synthase family protein [Deltaproteobacteria bacterium]|nr:FMN-binding glutamate synthase family protein [Deltaproteobacteria bacterium]